MNTLFVQTLIVAACVIVAVVYVLGRYLPRAAFAVWLQRHGHTRAAQIVRPGASGGACHSGGGGDGCSACGSCGSSPSRQETGVSEHPVRFHSPRH